MNMMKNNKLTRTHKTTRELPTRQKTFILELNKRNETLEAENKRLRNELNCFNMNNNTNNVIQEAVGVAKHHASTYR